MENTVFKQFIGTTEAAQLLGIATSTLYKLTSKNEIPFFRPHGKLILFDSNELDAWVRRSRVPSREEISSKVERYCSK